MRILNIVAMICLFFSMTSYAKNLVTVNGDSITIADYNRFMSQRKAKTYENSNKKEHRLIISSLVNRQLLVQAAIKLKLNKIEVYKSQMDAFNGKSKDKAKTKEIKNNLLVNLLLAKLSQAPQFSFETLQKDYETIKKRKSQDFHIHHILTKSKNHAHKALARLKKGEPFSVVAKSLSKDPSARHGGDLGWMSKNILPKTFTKVLSTKPGQYSRQPVKSKFGWHVIYIEAVRKIQLASFETIKNQLHQEKFSRHMAKYIMSLRKKAKITRLK